MNLAHAYRLLLTANHLQPQLLTVPEGRAEQQIRLMAHAGLVEAVHQDCGGLGSLTSITRVTKAGRQFLGALRGTLTAQPNQGPSRVAEVANGER